ncbi:MAG: hypothetical protein H0U79_06225 [Solirubrobacterales bacterium]|nr:hypothetical protein [Solirubrobacterales bacterium]
MQPLDLERHRDLSGIVVLALRLLRDHLGVFTALALIFVAPVTLLVDGVWGGLLADFDASVPVVVQVVGGLIDTLVVVPLVTAAHVVAVCGLGRGEAPSVPRSLRGGLAAFPAVVLVVLLYVLAVALGLLLLFVPGVWLLVRWYFGTQAVMVDGRRGPDALRRSAELVAGHWWRTAGMVLMILVLGTLLGVMVGGPLALAAVVVESGALFVIAQILGLALAYSFAALVGTLLFFDLRARHDPTPTKDAAGALGPRGAHNHS